MRKTLVIIIWLLAPFYLFGQNPLLTNQFIFNPLALNPAVAGTGDALTANLMYRNQWVGFSGAPKTLTFSTHSPMRKQNMGLGLSVINNQIGVSSETSIIGDYSFKIKMREGTLNLGLGGGFIMLNSAWAELRANDPNDDLIQNNSPTYLIPEVSLGVYYSTKKYHVGFSLPHMLSYTFNSTKDKYMIKNDFARYTYILTGDYIFDLEQQFKYVPSIMLKYQKSDNADFIFMNRLIYMDKYSVGMAFDSEQKVYKGMFQMQLNRQFSLGYVRDFNSTKINQYRKGSHEVMLRYDFKYTIKVHSPRNL